MHPINNGKGFPHSSVGKESACNAGDPGSIPGLRWSAGERIGYPLHYSWASLVAQLGKESDCNVGDLGLIPGLGRSPGQGKGYPLQYSGLENSMNYTVQGVTKGCTRLSNFQCIIMAALSLLSHLPHQGKVNSALVQSPPQLLSSNSLACL